MCFKLFFYLLKMSFEGFCIMKKAISLRRPAVQAIVKQLLDEATAPEKVDVPTAPRVLERQNISDRSRSSRLEISLNITPAHTMLLDFRLL